MTLISEKNKFFKSMACGNSKLVSGDAEYRTVYLFWIQRPWDEKMIKYWSNHLYVKILHFSSVSGHFLSLGWSYRGMLFIWKHLNVKQRIDENYTALFRNEYIVYRSPPVSSDG